MSKGKMVDILFYSRGRGRGHAVRDVEIIKELELLRSNLEIEVASYATGAATFRQLGRRVIDIDLPEIPSFPHSVLRAAKLFDELRPRVVLAQEDIAALTAAKIYDIPTILETHWFPVEHSCNRAAYRHADRVLFTEDPDIFEELKEVEGRVTYVGPIIRKLQASPLLRNVYRTELNLSQEDSFILIMPGSYPEELSRITSLVVPAVEDLKTVGQKKVIWIAGADKEALRGHLPSGWEVVEYFSEVEKWMIASNLLITKGTYNITREAEMLQVPSIALTHGINRIDDMFAKKMSFCRTASMKELTILELATLMTVVMKTESGCRSELSSLKGAQKAAKLIAKWV